MTTEVTERPTKRMPKWLKATLISLGGILGLVVVAVAVVCWIVFSPSKLTSIVNKVAKDVVTCEVDFERVSLSLFKTFPYAGLDVHNVTLVNPVEGAPSDTLAHISDLILAVNAKQFIHHGDIVVKQLLLEGTMANIYVSDNGVANYDILPPDEDTTSESKPFKLPDYIDIEKVKISHLDANYNDYHSGLFAEVNDFGATVKGGWQDAKANLDAEIKSKELSLVTADSLQNEKLTVSLSKLKISADGKMKDSTSADAKLKVNLSDIVLYTCDTAGAEVVSATFDKLQLSADARGWLNDMAGSLKLSLPKGDVSVSGMDYVTEPLKSRKGDLLSLKAPFKLNLDNRSLSLTDAELSVAEWALQVAGDVELPREERPLNLNLAFNTSRWDAGELLKVLPAKFTSWKKGMTLDADLQVTDGKVVGVVTDSTMPKIDARVELRDGKFYYSKAVPYHINNVAGDVVADLDLNKGAVSNVKIERLDADVDKNHVSVKGTLLDLMGRQDLDADLKARLDIADLEPFLDSVPVDVKGNANIAVHLRALVKNLTALDLTKIKAQGSVVVDKLDVVYDTIHATSPRLNVDLQLPAIRRTAKVGEVLSAQISSQTLNVEMPNQKIDASLNNVIIDVGLSNVLEKGTPLAVAFDIKTAAVKASMDTIDLNTNSLALDGSIKYDSTKRNLLKQLNPDLDIDLRNARLKLPGSNEPLIMPVFKFNYKPELCQIQELDLHFGMSDYHLDGSVTGLEDWLNHEAMLKGTLNFTSNYTDLDQLLDIISGIGVEKDTLERQRQEDHVAKEANPFIVPKDVDFRLNTRINHTSAFGNELSSVAGGITIKDGTMLCDQIGFVCKAAKMQLTAVYKSPRVNHLFLGFDFHLLDIQIAELIDMIPYIDTIVPMLASFDGNADFHLAAETYLNAYYKPKMSTLLGAAAITGKDLVVLDSKTFDQIAKLLMFKKSTVNKIDTLDVEIAVFDREAEVYPFVITMDKYKVCAAGRHNLDNAYDYHIELLKSPLPTRLAVDINGVMPKLNFKLGKVKYAELYKPERQNAVQQRTMALKNMIRQSLERNVKEETRNAKRFD
ncbi:MAG: hypothetical protein J5711_01180 [Bacteroidales bacterium]|nr:hypothetical protein [Bacteroidales bacterium]